MGEEEELTLDLMFMNLSSPHLEASLAASLTNSLKSVDRSCSWGGSCLEMFSWETTTSSISFSTLVAEEEVCCWAASSEERFARMGVHLIGVFILVGERRRRLIARRLSLKSTAGREGEY